MKKGMTISITLIMAMIVALVVALVLISMFSGIMGSGSSELSGSIDQSSGEGGVVCSTYCAKCCLTHDQDYCNDEDNGAPEGCQCPDC